MDINENLSKYNETQNIFFCDKLTYFVSHRHPIIILLKRV